MPLKPSSRFSELTFLANQTTTGGGLTKPKQKAFQEKLRELVVDSQELEGCDQTCMGAIFWGETRPSEGHIYILLWLLSILANYEN